MTHPDEPTAPDGPAKAHGDALEEAVGGSDGADREESDGDTER